MLQDTDGLPPANDVFDSYRALEALFDQVGDTVFFVKNQSCRYVSINQTLVERCGCSSKNEVLGRTAKEVFPAPMGLGIFKQDDQVVQSGRRIKSQLELHLYADGREGWCLTWKEPLYNAHGAVVGLSGISRDLGSRGSTPSDMSKVALVLNYIQSNFQRQLRIPDLAKIANMSSYQLENRIRTLMGMTIGQYIARKRIEHACDELRKSRDAIGTIALNCGYADQAAFSRQFRRAVGFAPGEYRKHFASKT